MDSGCLHDFTLDNRVSDFTFTTDDERLFLLELYQATGGPYYWLKRNGWGKDSAIHHCKWFGIECYQNSSYIKWVDLTANNLQSRPPNFWRLRNLQGLCLSRNKQMTGSIADIIAANMIRLRRLFVSFTEIYGVVPWSKFFYSYVTLRSCRYVARREKNYMVNCHMILDDWKNFKF